MRAAHWCWVSVVQCRPWKSSMIYHSDLRQERNDRLVSVHTSGEIVDLQWKYQASTGTGKEITGKIEHTVKATCFPTDGYIFSVERAGARTRLRMWRHVQLSCPLYVSCILLHSCNWSIDEDDPIPSSDLQQVVVPRNSISLDDNQFAALQATVNLTPSNNFTYGIELCELTK